MDIAVQGVAAVITFFFAVRAFVKEEKRSAVYAFFGLAWLMFWCAYLDWLEILHWVMDATCLFFGACLHMFFIKKML